MKLTAKETGGAFDLCETTAPPDSGPPPHRHSRDDEMFFILEGQFGLVFGDQSLTAKAGEAVYLPKNIVHTYKNIGSKPGRFLVWAMPSGFAEFVKAMESPVTNPHNPPPVNEATIGKLLGNIGRFGIEMLMEHRPKRQGPPLPAAQEFWFLGQRVTMHLTGDQTAGNFCVATFTMPPGTGMVAHRNKRETEMFYVLDGAAVFTLDELQITAAKGTLLYVPPGVMHSFYNPGRAPAKVLDVHTPAGIEGLIREAGCPCADSKGNPPPFDAKAVPFIKYGMELKSS